MGLALLRGWLMQVRQPPPVITGLVPVIPMVWSTAPARIGMAGTRPAMTAPALTPLAITSGCHPQAKR